MTKIGIEHENPASIILLDAGTLKCKISPSKKQQTQKEAQIVYKSDQGLRPNPFITKLLIATKQIYEHITGTMIFVEKASHQETSS